jgi:hypothetical protein
MAYGLMLDKLYYATTRVEPTDELSAKPWLVGACGANHAGHYRIISLEEHGVAP